jgi:hypothetical protein
MKTILHAPPHLKHNVQAYKLCEQENLEDLIVERSFRIVERYTNLVTRFLKLFIFVSFLS